ncbi:molybdopterin synthase catalytic subunit [Aspergillus nomiae NRRL 13137]|uniref:Molybdopterin synthase catalytic subunit n=1 Tax=Aspergillus nomiae NRRL (strain ATCC 15546 / NRRL 13137 / CBS 260.88 / M93) TaxID=1509407 RepID=A0A0L1JE50_ASPN3|nr:molybdopterin synthase catalytic subunit [Aspergillus nomiae NRRL 13137]KNG90079.1 molybdopterin synthase catalytic subunit [Aspergillus nomiae NRRL 13137]
MDVSTATSTVSYPSIPSETENSTPAHLDRSTFPRTVTLPDEKIHIELTYDPLSADTALSYTSSPAAGANVFFLGTREIHSTGSKEKHGLIAVSISHRLGTVAVGEASILIAVSSGHRRAAWRAAEEILDECKAKAEIWKREEFVGSKPEDGEWRANKDWDGEGI